MTKKAIIFDLDNTIYAAPPVVDGMFASLLQLIEDSGEHNSHIKAIRSDMMRKPFQVLATTHGFSESLTQQGIAHLETLTYNKPLSAFPDYHQTKEWVQDKFLVTSGFQLLQMSKVRSLGIENDFTEIHIVDIDKTNKKQVFADIIRRRNYAIEEVLVIGDDLNSEIQAARELGIDAVLYDSLNLYPDEQSLPRITDYKDLTVYLRQ